MKNNNYNKIAWCYDFLSKAVFGNTIKKAQIEMLGFIPADSRILIVGGGTGWILEEITKLHSSGLSVIYIDASARMIQLSKKRNVGLNKIEFISKNITAVELKEAYFDVAITNFFFDNFNQDDCLKVFEQIDHSLNPEGKWLFSDFELTQKSKLWQKAIVKFMYLFFKITAGIQAKHLPYPGIYFLRDGYKILCTKYFYNNLIVSKVFGKT